VCAQPVPRWWKGWARLDVAGWLAWDLRIGREKERVAPVRMDGERRGRRGWKETRERSVFRERGWPPVGGARSEKRIAKMVETISNTDFVLTTFVMPFRWPRPEKWGFYKRVGMFLLVRKISNSLNFYSRYTFGFHVAAAGGMPL
jgi:hypothetical protein